MFIDANVVYLIKHGKGSEVGSAAAAADGEVQENVVAETFYVVGKGIHVVVRASACSGLGCWDVVEEFIVQVQAYGLGRPVHSPDVELRRP